MASLSKKRHDDFIKELQSPVYASIRNAIMLKNSVWTNATSAELELLADLEIKMEELFGPLDEDN